MTDSIALIIPNQDQADELHILLKEIPNWTLFPDEIIIVDSSKEKFKLPSNLSKFCIEKKISPQVIYGQNYYPGRARNIGISSAKSEVIAFLDSATLPSSDWLRSGLCLLKEDNCQLVWGLTKYLTENSREDIIRASSYGSFPIQTLPGTILFSEVFKACGLFIGSARAGEDGDWIQRVELQEVRTSVSKEILSYTGLIGMSYLDMIKKWKRNYIFAASLPYFKVHKNLYLYPLYVLTVLFAFNWNNLFAGWDPDNFFYISNVTKLSAFSLFMLYVILRGIIFPTKKGVKLRFLLPYRFIKVFFLSAALDLVKAIAFVQNKLKKNNPPA